MPSPTDVALAVPVATVAAFLFGWFAFRLRSERNAAVAYTRKLFHIGIFSTAAWVHIAGGVPAVLVFGGTVAVFVLHAAWRGPGHRLYDVLARPGDAPHGTLFIIVPLAATAVGGLLVSLWVPRFAAVGYLVAGWGDAAGEPAGERWGRHRYRVPSLRGVRVTRSIEGSLAVLAAGIAAAMVGLAPTGVSGGWITTAVAAGAAGAAVEAVSTHGLDNLTVQLAAAGAAALVAG
jgi:phytol kinase